MELKTMYIVYMGILIVVAVIAFGLGSQGNEEQSHGNIFVGRIVNQQIANTQLSGGNVLTDEGCEIDPYTGLSNCTSEIRTNQGTFSFNYEHDMMAQPCLSEGDIANLNVLSNGKAIVTRTYWAGGGA